MLRHEKQHVQSSLVQSEASSAAQLATIEKHKQILEEEKQVRETYTIEKEKQVLVCETYTIEKEKQLLVCETYNIEKEKQVLLCEMKDR